VGEATSSPAEGRKTFSLLGAIVVGNAGGDHGTGDGTSGVFFRLSGGGGDCHCSTLALALALALAASRRTWRADKVV
jgi:hypothetical protein